MTTYTERKLVPYKPQQLFDLVADVAKYPSFLPWCVGARIRSRKVDELVADLTIGFGPFRESFTSRVTLQHADETGFCAIKSEYENGPFKYLHNRWKFTPDAQGCVVDFYVDFAAKSHRRGFHRSGTDDGQCLSQTRPNDLRPARGDAEARRGIKSRRVSGSAR
jgi:coenzyme Q-binding protein COQ10